MAKDGEGKMYVDLADFYTWLIKHNAPELQGMEYVIGVPKMNLGTGELEINYAFSNTETSPTDWAEKPKAVLEIEALQKGKS